MRFLIFTLFCATLFSSMHAQASLTTNQCRIIKMWKAGISGKGICEENGGIFCSSVSNVGEGMCRAADGSLCGTIDNPAEGLCSVLGGTLCSQVDSIAEGICRGMNGTFCRSLDTDGEKLWLFKLDEACSPY